MALYDPELQDELDEVFHDAHENIASQIQHTKDLKKVLIIQEEEEKSSLLPSGLESDSPIRKTLPFFKDPKIKVSIWKIFKDSIGKDISKIAVPVYFNQPLSILQACAQPTEHGDMLDRAVAESDPIKRLALIGVYCAF
jgi:oxysterol-binding protein 1